MVGIRRKYLAHVQNLFAAGRRVDGPGGAGRCHCAADGDGAGQGGHGLGEPARPEEPEQRPQPRPGAGRPPPPLTGRATSRPSPPRKTKHYLVATPGFLSGVEQLIKSEPLSAWKAYLRWWTLHGNAQLLSKAFVEENFDFYGRTLSGAPQMQPRWRRCVRFADRDLGYALGQAYVAKAFLPESKVAVEAMVKNIEAALAMDIEQLDWMSAASKQAAVTKLKAIEDKFGYPKNWRDYSSVVIGRTSLVQERAPRHRLRGAPRAQQNREAGGPPRVDDDAAHHQRLLRSAAQHHQLPGRNSPAALLRCDARHRRQLRRHRHGDWP